MKIAKKKKSKRNKNFKGIVNPFCPDCAFGWHGARRTGYFEIPRGCVRPGEMILAEKSKEHCIIKRAKAIVENETIKSVGRRPRYTRDTNPISRVKDIDQDNKVRKKNKNKNFLKFFPFKANDLK